MDQFVTTYRKDYLWPYIRSFGKKLLEPPLTSAGFEKKCLCRCYPPVKPEHTHDNLSPNFNTQEQDWSRIGPMGPLLEPKLYPVQVGKSPETNTMRLDQPNTFLRKFLKANIRALRHNSSLYVHFTEDGRPVFFKHIIESRLNNFSPHISLLNKLQEKYPFLYEILQTSPTADLLSKVNKDRLRTTYQVDYCKMDEYPPDDMLRASGVGLGPCSEPIRLPGDPYRPNQTSASFKASMQSPAKQIKRNKCISGSGGGGKSSSGSTSNSGGGDNVPWAPNNSEYQDGISKIGGLIIKDKLHYHTKQHV